MRGVGNEAEGLGVESKKRLVRFDHCQVIRGQPPLSGSIQETG